MAPETPPTEVQPTEIHPKPKKRRGRGARNANAEDRKAEIAWAKRRAELVKLLTGGWTLTDAAKKLGYSDASHARRDYQRALADIPAPNVEEARKEIDLQVSAVIKGGTPKMRKGSAGHGELILHALALKAKLLGIADERVRIHVEAEQRWFLDKLEASLPADTYAQVIAVLAGKTGEGAVGGTGEAPGGS